MEGGVKSIVRTVVDAEPISITVTDFVAPKILSRPDVAKRKEKLAEVVAAEIVPRLRLLHANVLPTAEAAALSDAEIRELARLVLSPNLQAAAAYVTYLRDRGLSMETLFVELLQPAAQHLGKMWDNDECDFVDVTLGVGQLQKLLAIFNCTQDLPALNAKRRVFLTLTPGEQHSFGLAMVAKLLRAAGWQVIVATEPTIELVKTAVSRDWFAVAGVTVSSEPKLDDLCRVTAAVRKNSKNPAIGIMVGGPPFSDNPDLVLRVGADATATNATTAVILAQKLFDLGARRNWLGTGP